MESRFFWVAVVAVIFGGVCKAQESDGNAFEHTLVLDDAGKYVLTWLTDFEENKIYFNVTVNTKGYVGFGLSKKGLMLGADIVIGGVQPNGSKYFSDRHGVADHQTEMDASQDWKLDGAWESHTHTFLSFSRAFETCDKTNDYPINQDSVTLIWAFGERDNYQNHYQNRGAMKVNLLDPDLAPGAVRQLGFRNSTQPTPVKNIGDWKVWRIPVNLELPVQDTAHICTFHRAPTKTKQHIVGLRAVLGERERQFVHRISLQICHAPSDVNADLLFGRFLGHPGQQCYALDRLQNEMPTQYCQEIRHVWGVGAEPIFFPDHVGLPLSSTPQEYYLLRVHYDNPQEIPGVKMQYSLEAYYTDQLRKYDLGLLHTGVTQSSAVSILVPPSDTNHVIYGHCAAACTKKIIPENGINVFAGLLHTHSTGTGVRALLIQNQTETALLVDDNYTPTHQPIRTLLDEKKILPGDMIVDRCIYDTSNRTEAAVGGISVRNEACNVFLWYYPLIEKGHFSICSGELRSDAYRNSLQIFQTIWSDDKREEVITSPPNNAGLTVSEALSTVNWDISKRTELQTHHRFLPQVTSCPSLGPEAVTENLLQQSQAGQQNITAAPQPPVLLKRFLQAEESGIGYPQPQFMEGIGFPLPQFVEGIGYPLHIEEDVNYLQVEEGKNYYQVEEPTNYQIGTFTALNKELRKPGSEFVSLWPREVTFYRPPTICPAN